jgi:hypothetical protein
LQLALSDRVVMFTMFLLPIPTFLGEAAARAADAVRFGAASGRLLAAPRVKSGSHFLRASLLLLSMFGFALLSLIGGVSHTLRDMLDVLRVAAFWVMFHFGASLVRRHAASPLEVATACLRLLLTIGVLNAAFTACQYMFPELTRPLQALFATGDTHINLLAEQHRAFGFFMNPNTNAIMLLLLGLPGVTLYRLTSRSGYLCLGAVVLAAIVLTGSRTGLVLAAVAIAVYCTTSLRWNYLLVLAALAWGGYAALDYLVSNDLAHRWFPYLSELLFKIHDALHGEGVDLSTINSFNARLVHWERTMEWYYARPLLGSGPLREELPSFADNYYIYLLSRYGFVGMTMYGLFSAYLAGLALLAIIRRRSPQRDWAMLTLASLAVVNVANYTIDAFIIVPVGSVCLIYWGFMVALMDLPAAARHAGMVPNSGRRMPRPHNLGFARR